MDLPSSDLNPRSASNCPNSSDWLNKICQIQRSKASPEVLQSLQERASKQKRALKSYKAAEVMERCNQVSSRAQTSNLRKAYYMSPSFAHSAPPSSVPSAPVQQERLEAVTAKSSSAAFNVQSILQTFRAGSVQQQQNDNDNDEYIQEAENQLALMEAEANADEEESSALPQEMGIEVEAKPIGFDALLESLAVEPTDPVEMSAKFAVFENLLSTVVALREQTISFWEENKDQFDGVARRAGEKSIRDIDNASSMSILESSSKWFVYFMMKKAHQNSLSISKLLNEIKARLELLSKEDIECPFCLDPILPDNCIVLGCCHKACQSCWNNWSEIMHSRTFCPLCRHEEFVQEVLA